MRRRIMYVASIYVLFLPALACDHSQHSIKIDLTAVAGRLQEAFDAHDAVALAGLYAEDAYYLSASDPEPLIGRKAIEESHKAFFQAFTDVSTEFTRRMVCGDHIIIEGKTRGTHRGPLARAGGEVAATNRTISVTYACILKVSAAGLIAEDRTYFDSAIVMQQLGLE